MKKKFKTIIIPLILLSFLNPTYSSQFAKITISGGLPTELNLLIESYDIENETKENQNKFHALINELDKYFQVIPKNQLSFLIKSQIYKDILDSKNKADNLIPIDDKSINRLNTLLGNQYESFNPFCKWLIESIQSDIWELSSSSQFYQDKSSGHSNANGVTKFSKRDRLLSPWYSFFLQTAPELINKKIQPLILSILQSLYKNVRIYVEFSKFKNALTQTKKNVFFKLSYSEKATNKNTSAMNLKTPIDPKKEIVQPGSEEKIEAIKVVEKINIVPTPNNEIPTNDKTSPDESWKPK